MRTIQKSIEVNVPVSLAYKHWTQFEQVPQIMGGIRDVVRIGDKRLHWHVKIGGKDKEWDSEIVDQIPDERIAWRSTSGARNSGAVHFVALEKNKARISVSLNYELAGVMESIGDAVGVLDEQINGNLKEFKKFVERRGSPPAA